MTAQKIDSNGFIEIPDNPLSKVGIYEYWGAEIDAPIKDKLYKVLRPAEELSRLETIDSFKGMPLINDHTMLGEGQTAPEKKGIDGVIGDNVYFQDGTLYGNLRLYTNKIKSLIKKGKRDLSMGYYSRYEFTPGHWQGQAYDAVQRFISGNHVALVDNGRMGDTVAVLDSDSRLSELTITFDHNIGIDMAATTEEVQAIVSEALAPLLATMDAQAKELTALRATLDAEPDDDEEGKKTVTEDEHAEPDGDEGKKTATEDEESEEKDDKKETMDAAAFAAQVRDEIKKADELYKIVSPLVGTFDHSSMSSAQIAEYGAKQLKLNGDPETAVRTYALAMKKQKTATQDAKSPNVSTTTLTIGAFN